MGRRAVEIDLEQLEKLAAMQCTQEDVAAWFGVSQPTISKKLRQRKYREVWERGLGRGRISLRRRQWAKDSDTMLIWLGKQHLGQRDQPVTDDGSRSAAEEYLALQKGERPGEQA